MPQFPDRSRIGRTDIVPWSDPSPVPTGKTKHQYILEWLTFYDCYLYDAETDQFINYHTDFITIAFEWVKAHYRELELGGSSKWHEAARAVLYHLSMGSWNKNTENHIKAYYLNQL